MSGKHDRAAELRAIDAFRNALELPRWYSDDELLSAIRAYLEAATPPDELSGNPGELIDKMADAIRGDTILDDTPWETLSEDRKVGWRGDAERALAVVKEHLTAHAATALRLSAGGCKTERRKFYHHGYSTAELLKARKSPPEFFTDDGEAWRYEYTHSDGEGGAYDMLYRPASPTVEAGHVE